MRCGPARRFNCTPQDLAKVILSATAKQVDPQAVDPLDCALGPVAPARLSRAALECRQGLTGRRAAVSIKAMLPVSNDGVGPAVRTKAALIEELARIMVLPRKEVAILIEHILDSMVRAIQRGEKVEIRGFGTFNTRQRQGRIGRNPKTGARVEIPGNEFPSSNPARNCANS